MNDFVSRLIPYYSEYPNIRDVIDQCDLTAMKRCSAVPRLQLYKSPGICISSLLHSAYMFTHTYT